MILIALFNIQTARPAQLYPCMPDDKACLEAWKHWTPNHKAFGYGDDAGVVLSPKWVAPDKPGVFPGYGTDVLMETGKSPGGHYDGEIAAPPEATSAPESATAAPIEEDSMDLPSLGGTHATRKFVGPKDVPPTEFAAYGVVVFPVLVNGDRPERVG